MDSWDVLQYTNLVHENEICIMQVCDRKGTKGLMQTVKKQILLKVSCQNVCAATTVSQII